jgi:hypothetical protein
MAYSLPKALGIYLRLRRSGELRRVRAGVLREYLARHRKYHCFASARTDIDGKQTHDGFRLLYGPEFLPTITTILGIRLPQLKASGDKPRTQQTSISQSARRRNPERPSITFLSRKNHLRMGTRCRHLAIA